MSEKDMNENIWSYTKHAEFYKYRPNYSPEAIKKLLAFVGAKSDPDYVVADIGAGTGNLTIMLKNNVGKVISIEPNEAMREIGIETTKEDDNVTWQVGTGEKSNLEANSVNLVTFGSSFNTCDRDKALIESHRILKNGGFFCCMWNNRDLNESTQKKVENIIKMFVPDYEHGTRRQQQADVIIGSKLFNDLHYMEEDQIIEVSVENYILAWQSVKNPYWDLETEEGKKLFQKMCNKIREEFKDVPKLKLKYTTKIWIAKRVD